MGEEARDRGRAAAGGDLGADERTELERLRSENAQLKVERDFAKKVETWFANDQ